MTLNECNLVAGFTAAYDPAGNKLFERHLHAECRSTSYLIDPGDGSVLSGYDSADRLVGFQRGALNDDGVVGQLLTLSGVRNMEQYTLDGAGNLADAGASVAVTFGIGGGEYDESRSVNALNQIADVDGVSPAYDARGNLTQYQGMTYSYDAFNRLVTATGGSNGAVTMSYDALGRRAVRTVSGTGTYYNFSDDQVIEERSTGALLRQYVWGQYIDELIQQREFARAPSGMASIDYYPLSDLHYRTVALTQEFCGSSSSAGPGGVVGQSGIVEVYDVDPWGKTTAYSAPGADGVWFSDDDVTTSNPLCKYLFTGREFEPDLGLYYYRARYYHPELGVFLSRDPLLYGAGDMNLYRYCMGNPGVYTDPEGEFIPLLVGLAVVAILGYIAYKANSEEPVEGPGLWESLIPVWGSSRMAIYDFQTGHPIWGLVNTGLAVSDIFLVKSLVMSGGRLLARGGVRVAGRLFARTAEEETVAVARKRLAEKYAEYMRFRGQGHTAAEAGRLLGVRSANPTLLRRVPWSYGKTAANALGETDKFGNITIRAGLTGKDLAETVAHEGVHRLLSPRATSFLGEFRANIRMAAYDNSHFVQFLEEAAAESWATGSLRQGLSFPFRLGYVSGPRVFIEGVGYISIVGGAAYGGYQLGQGDGR